MSNVEFLSCHHLNVAYDGSKFDKDRILVWNNFFTKMEKLSQNVKSEPISSLVFYSQNKALGVLVTGKDLFLAIYNHKSKLLSNISTPDELDDFLYLKTSKLIKMYERLELISKGTLAPEYPSSLMDKWGKYTGRVRAEESAISRLPHGVALARDFDQPFVLDVRKDKPFEGHDFAYRFDFNNPVHFGQAFADGEPTSMEALKSLHTSAYNLFSSLDQIQKGEDLSRESANDLADAPYEIDEWIR